MKSFIIAKAFALKNAIPRSPLLGTTAYILQTRILDKGYSAAAQRQVKKAKVKGE